ncbi:MAG TPA: M13 family metallopeptidase [Thermoanaerobaculia bacterium]|nr:M13 family metallopeptidase [Thermoanaerobaculia bacterium]
MAKSKVSRVAALIVALLSCLSLAAAGVQPLGTVAAGAPPSGAAAAAAPSAAAVAPAATSSSPPTGVNLEAMDPKVDPCVDFYRYACSGWMAKHPIPPDRSTWGRFAELAERNRAQLRKILEAAAAEQSPGNASPPATSGGSPAASGAAPPTSVFSASGAPAAPPEIADRRKLGDFYATCMDEAGIEARGISPLAPDLDRIAALKSAAELPALLAHLRSSGVNALFALRSGQDQKDATAVIAIADQSGLGLPDRDYYLKTDAKSVEQRDQYAAHVQRMFSLLGEPAERAAADAAAVLEIETALAKASLDRVSRRDPYKLYHKLSRQELAALTPSFGWDAFLSGIEAPPFSSLNVTEPGFFKEVDALLRAQGIEAWKAYLRWHLIHAAAPYLQASFVNENFSFYGKTLAGTKQLQQRWERCVEAADRTLGDALGREYVAAAFDPQAKERTRAMVAALESSMARDISALPWMGEVTRRQALAKLSAIANRIAYPDVWRDYSRLAIVRGDLLGNVQRGSAFELKRRLDKIGKPVDRHDWNMTPPTVNAYYNASMNDINFPAGILQTPFYDPRRDDAVNYGGIGAVIGHEMTHGFDDSGRKYDGRGNLADWWTPIDGKEFEQRAGCVADEYSSFQVADGLKVNGRLTLGENVADNGGLRISYMAYTASMAGKPRTILDGLTPEQRFFLGFAQVWCSNTSPEAERLQVLTNPHSPARFRVDGVVVNMPEFQEAFQCKPGAPMAPEKRCRVW